MNWALFNPRAAISSPIQLCLYCAVPLCRQDSLSLDTVGHPLNTTLHNHSSLQTLWTHCAPFYSLLLWVAILQQETSLRDRHPDLTVTSIVRPNQAMTIVTPYVWIYALRHLDSSERDQLGCFRKGTQCADSAATPGEQAAFVTYSSSHSAPMGPLVPWGVQRETDHGWKTAGILGDHGGTEQINPGDYCQTACSSGFRTVKMGSGLTWTCFNWAQPPAKGGDAQCRRHKWMAFICKGSDLLFHFMW